MLVTQYHSSKSAWNTTQPILIKSNVILWGQQVQITQEYQSIRGGKTWPPETVKSAENLIIRSNFVGGQMSGGLTLRWPQTFDDDGEDGDDDGEDDDDEDKCQEGVSTLRCPQTFDDVTDRPQNTDVKRNVSSIQLNTNFHWKY